MNKKKKKTILKYIAELILYIHIIVIIMILYVTNITLVLDLLLVVA